MPTTLGHFKLTPEQRHFNHMLEKYSQLLSSWDCESRDCHLQQLEAALPTMSHAGADVGEVSRRRLWLVENKFDFDFIDAAATLDTEHLQVVIEWLAEPVFS